MTVVVIGSSGGGTATLGHTDPIELLNTIHKELGRIRYEKEDVNIDPQSIKRGAGSRMNGISFALFISLKGGKGMDSANLDKDIATLWTVGFDNREEHIPKNRESPKFNSKSNEIKEIDNLPFLNVKKYYSGLLREVNQKCRELEKRVLVPAIHEKNSTIRGMICISCEPRDVNFASLSAVTSSALPVTGSGGSSLSIAASLHEGMKLIGNSGGSVATTTYTRAVSYSHALSVAWGDSYSPYYDSFNNSGKDTDTNSQKPLIGSILDSCLPSFLAVCFFCRILETLKHYSLATYMFQRSWIDQLLTQLRYQALPTVCSVVVATSYAPEHGSTAIMASTISSMACSGSIFSALLGGWIVSRLLGRVLFCCIKMKIPATMTNILVAGCLGGSVALLLRGSGATDFLSWVTQFIRNIVQSEKPTYGRWDGKGFGFLIGCIFCYGSKVGWYHSIFLPIILIEMEHGEASFWGSIDECVVIISAGICAGNLVTNKNVGSFCKRGLTINLLYGDFIEAAHPFMEASIIVNLACYIAVGVSTEILYKREPSSVMSSAYVPFFVSILLAEDRMRVIYALVSAFTWSFSGIVLYNNFLRKI